MGAMERGWKQTAPGAKTAAGARQGEGGDRIYLCIDLKTFYASVECADRRLNPFATNLVVADPRRGDSTICLAVTPAMKRLGVRNRCRVFEIPRDIRYTKALPRMRRYMEVSAAIYGIYLRYVSAQDVHVYSIDECFIDATPYLGRPGYGDTARAFARTLMDAVMREEHIPATAGIGPNLFLAKVALDVLAKHEDDGIAELDQESFRQRIWPHRPITDIWGIGPGTARKLAAHRVYDLMGVAALDEQILYRELGVSAEYLIDHAHGREPCTIAQIRAYRPAASSLASGQVLSRDYGADEARTVVREMVDAAVLELVARGAAAGGISLQVGYGRGAAPAPGSCAACVDPARHSAVDDTVMIERRARVAGAWMGGIVGEEALVPVGIGHGGSQAGRTRRVARGAFGGAGGQRRLPGRTNSLKRIMAAFMELFDEQVDSRRAIRRVNIGLTDLVPEELIQDDLFTDVEAEAAEHRLAEAVNEVRNRFGKNALLRGTSFEPGATARERNLQVGGHHA